MIAQRSFGRRPNSQAAQRPQAAAVTSLAASPVQEVAAQFEPSFSALTDLSLHRDEDLEEWKKARRFTIPWRQISLMATLCFGIASLVLPDSVNGAVQWLLYALMAASLYAGLRKRRRAET